MAKPHGANADGTPVDLIGRPFRPASHGVGVTFRLENDPMAKAQTDGIYTLNGSRFVIRKGDTLPDGAVMEGAEDVAEPAADEAPATRSKGAAPENRAKADEAETR
jgi:hypothetical protein